MFDQLSDLGVFWLLWSATLGITAYAVLRNYFHGKSLYGFPLLAGLMFSYFYVFQAYFVASDLGFLLEPWMLGLGQALVLVCFIAMMIGWRFGLKRKRIRGISTATGSAVDYRTMWNLGVLAAVIAIVSLHLFKYEQNYDWEGTSAYWYMLYHSGYPGLLACALAMVNDDRYQRLRHKLILLVLAIALTYIFFLSARRGPVFPLVIFIVYGFGLVSPKKPKKMLVILSLLGIGLAMLTFPHVRNYAEGYMSAWDVNSVSALSLESITVGKAQNEADNEYLYHSATIATAYEFDNYQNGTGYLSLLTHWIPRSLWPEKPSLGEGWYTWTPSLVPALLGWEMSLGAAAGGVAETFMEVGFFSPLIWLFLGYVMAKLFVGSYASRSLLRPAQFIAVMASTHWLISQGLVAAAVPMLIYVVTITIIIKLSIRQRPDALVTRRSESSKE